MEGEEEVDATCLMNCGESRLTGRKEEERRHKYERIKGRVPKAKEDAARDGRSEMERRRSDPEQRQKDFPFFPTLTAGG